jgi:hypothetical protein
MKSYFKLKIKAHNIYLHLGHVVFKNQHKFTFHNIFDKKVRLCEVQRQKAKWLFWKIFL